MKAARWLTFSLFIAGGVLLSFALARSSTVMAHIAGRLMGVGLVAFVLFSLFGRIKYDRGTSVSDQPKLPEKEEQNKDPQGPREENSAVRPVEDIIRNATSLIRGMSSGYSVLASSVVDPKRFWLVPSSDLYIDANLEAAGKGVSITRYVVIHPFASRRVSFSVDFISRLEKQLANKITIKMVDLRVGDRAMVQSVRKSEWPDMYLLSDPQGYVMLRGEMLLDNELRPIDFQIDCSREAIRLAQEYMKTLEGLSESLDAWKQRRGIPAH